MGEVRLNSKFRRRESFLSSVDKIGVFLKLRDKNEKNPKIYINITIMTMVNYNSYYIML